MSVADSIICLGGGHQVSAATNLRQIRPEKNELRARVMVENN